LWCWHHLVQPSSEGAIDGASTSEGEGSQDDDHKPISAPKLFDISSFQQYANAINGNLGGKDYSSSDDDNDSDSKSDEKSAASSSSSSSSSDDDSIAGPGEGSTQCGAFHEIQKSLGANQGGSNMVRNRSPRQERNSITLQSLAGGSSSRNLGEDSVAYIANALIIKQELSKQGVRFADEVDEKQISKLRQSCINQLFYASADFAAFKYEAFMEECGLDPNEYEWRVPCDDSLSYFRGLLTKPGSGSWIVDYASWKGCYQKLLEVVAQEMRPATFRSWRRLW
jgi:hypothetical protein